MLDKAGFDNWSKEYDQAVEIAKTNKGYPFEGYDEAHKYIIERVLAKPNATVMDIGFGTAKLTEILYKNGCTIFGQDFSEKMIEIAQTKMPEAHLYQGDFSLGLVEELKENTYDYILATYSLHHIDDDKKEIFLNELLTRLKEGGSILIGDVAFETSLSRKECKKMAGEKFDEDEYYIVVEDFIKRFPTLEYKVISPCACVIELKNDQRSE